MGHWVGVAGHVSIDRYHRLYLGVGPYLGSPGVEGSFFAGGRDQERLPTRTELEALLTGWGWNLGAGFVAGAGRSWIGDVFTGFVGRTAATEGGITTEGVTLNYQYSFGPWQLPANFNWDPKIIRRGKRGK